ncbi:LysR family transcriptional regulator [Imbroritus primus]|uniref:LysR family transcriptional regulator n=1 Tax=Imbroritus primus TaxID=3058603 RepID=A0ACD3SSF6_9BURK|nr:LysR family transcriptional regulator [Burkholderiaceae bacterium PBA]
MQFKVYAKVDIAELDLKLLVAFEAMLHTRNVTAAADAIGITQPAMSTALGKLRKVLADPLFVRTSQGMEPTPFAMELAEPIRDALQLLRQTLNRDKHFDAATSTRTFRIVMTDIGERVFLPGLLQHLSTVAPHVSVRTVQLPVKEMRDALESGEMDLAVGFIPDLTSGYYQQRLFNRSYVCIARTNHPHIGDTLSLEQYLAASHAIVSAPGTGHDVVERVLAEKGYRRRIALHVTHFLAIPLIVANTDLVVTIPTMLAESYLPAGNIKMLTPPLKMPVYAIRQYWHERFHEDPANKWLRELFCDLFRD